MSAPSHRAANPWRPVLVALVVVMGIGVTPLLAQEPTPEAVEAAIQHLQDREMVPAEVRLGLRDTARTPLEPEALAARHSLLQEVADRVGAGFDESDVRAWACPTGGTGDAECQWERAGDPLTIAFPDTEPSDDGVTRLHVIHSMIHSSPSYLEHRDQQVVTGAERTYQVEVRQLEDGTLQAEVVDALYGSWSADLPSRD